MVDNVKVKGWWKYAADQTNSREEKQHSGGEDKWNTHGLCLIDHWWGFKTALLLIQNKVLNTVWWNLTIKQKYYWAAANTHKRWILFWWHLTTLLPRQFGITTTTKHNERNSSHEVISMAQHQLHSRRGMRRMETGTVGVVKYSHFRQTQLTGLWLYLHSYIPNKQ